MGYVHSYAYNPSTITEEKRIKLCRGARMICSKSKKMGIIIGDGAGQKQPNITEKSICFNGSTKQPKGRRTAQGKANSLQRPDNRFKYNEDTYNKVSGKRFAGDLMSQVSAPNPDHKDQVDASYETFFFPRIPNKEDYGLEQGKEYGEGRYRSFTKTNFYPYDIPLTAFLIYAQHILGKDNCKIMSDGRKKDRVEGYMLCKKATGVGEDFYLQREEIHNVIATIEKKLNKEIYVRKFLKYDDAKHLPLVAKTQLRLKYLNSFSQGEIKTQYGDLSFVYTDKTTSSYSDAEVVAVLPPSLDKYASSNYWN